MKRWVLLGVMMFWAACQMAKADEPVFGNSTNGTMSGLSIVCEGQEGISGGAIEFKPLENINVSSVTLWIAGYTLQSGQNIYAGIWSDNNAPNAPLINFSSPAPNNGNAASFVFANASPANQFITSTVLSANVLYWLVVSSEAPQGQNESAAVWLEGGNTSGGADYHGADIYNIYNGTFNSTSIEPAFSINSVPEPGFGALISLPLLFGIAQKLRKNHRHEA